jgi:hypothetical protein
MPGSSKHRQTFTGPRLLVLGLLYAIAFLAWFYGLATTDTGPRGFAVLVFFAGNVAIGLWIGKAWASVLPSVIPLLSIPVASEPWFWGSATWFEASLFVAFVAVATILAGVLARALSQARWR